MRPMNRTNKGISIFFPESIHQANSAMAASHSSCSYVIGRGN